MASKAKQGYMGNLHARIYLASAELADVAVALAWAATNLLAAVFVALTATTIAAAWAGLWHALARAINLVARRAFTRASGDIADTVAVARLAFACGWVDARAGLVTGCTPPSLSAHAL